VEFGARLLWPTVAARFATVFAEVAGSVEVADGQPDWRVGQAGHLATLTDENGIIQFANGATPDLQSGDCVDDAPRLAVVAAGYAAASAPRHDRARATGWLASALSLLKAAARADGMHNQLGYDGVWRDSPHLGDHVGRACWGLGVVASQPVPADLRARARTL